MLTKLAQQVLVPGHAAVAFRAYSKSCPAPPPPAPVKHWVTKTVCGTKNVYTFKAYLTNVYGGIATGTLTEYVLPGLPTTSVQTGMPYDNYSVISGTTVLISSAPYCKTVTVYE